MLLLTKCCCCFNLRYGFLAYGILSIAARLMLCISLYQSSKIYIGNFTKLEKTEDIQILLSQVLSIYGGWVITSVICLFFTLKGIIQKRSILIYPYIIILVVELFGIYISAILSSIYFTPYFLIILPIATPILIYELWSLISLYKHIRTNEKMLLTIEEMTPLDTVC